MYCHKCGVAIPDGANFCEGCGNKVEAGTESHPQGKIEMPPTLSDNSTPPIATEGKSKTIIKCGNCGYIGPGEPGRSMWAKILALICIFGAPLITIIYFLVTYEYRCPKCQSTFLGIKRRDDKDFVSQSKTRRPLIIFLKILLVIAVIGILSAVVLASLNTARQKGASAANDGWTTYNSVTDGFSVLLPTYPTVDSQSNTASDGNTYVYNTYIARKDANATFNVFDYKYRDPIDVSNPNALLEKLLNGMVNGTGGKLISSDYTYYSSYPALNYSIDVGTELIKGQIILVNQTPFMLGYDYGSGTYNDTDYQRFISSLQIK